jgi:hypothetical protein
MTRLFGNFILAILLADLTGMQQKLNVKTDPVFFLRLVTSLAKWNI